MRSCRSGGWFAVGFVFALGLPAAQADIYKWVGDDGVIFYSSTPPKSRATTVVEVFASEDEPVPATVPVAPPPSAVVEALAARVEQLENELAEERRARAPPPPPPQRWAGGCDPSYAGCEWSPGHLPPTVIVTGPIFHPRHHFVHRHFAKDPRFVAQRFHHAPRFVPKRFHDHRHFLAPRVGERSVHIRSAPFGFRSGRHGFRMH